MPSSEKLLKTYEFLHEAELDRIKLKNEEVESRLVDHNTVGVAPHYGPALGGIKMYVDKNDFERANEILSRSQTMDKQLQQLFHNQETEPIIQCPNCNSTNIFEKRSFLSGLLFLISFILPISTPGDKFHCANCDHTWKSE